jgi:PAS domain S-box-containing protein
MEGKMEKGQEAKKTIDSQKASFRHSTGLQDEKIGLTEMLQNLKPHDHLCLIYESKEEWRDAVIPFISIGLKKAEKCIYIVDTSTADEIRRYLSEDGIDAASAEKSGQLSILHHTEAYNIGGSFDPDRMIAMLISETEKAISEGYHALRVTGEMTWVFGGHAGSEKFLEYEAKLNRDFFPKYPCLAICQYDRWKFNPEIIKGVIMTHPLIIRGSRIYRNFYYILPEEFLRQKFAEEEVQHWLNNLERERRLAEDIQMHKESLKQSEETYRNLFQNAQVGLFRTRISDGKILESNEQLALMFGYDSREEFIEKYVTSPNYVDPGTREKMIDMIRKDGVIKNFEARFYRKDLSIFWARYSAKIYPDKGWIEGVAEDITEQKLAEQALRESEEKYRELFDNAPIGYHELDRNGVIVRVNHTQAEMLGYNVEEMLGQPIWKFIKGKEIREMILGKLLGEIPPGKSFDREYIQKDGMILPILADDKLIRDKEGNIIGLRTTVQDVSRIKKIEQEKQALESELRQSQKMEAIGQLAGGIAHDFNNILTVINGYCALSLLGLKKGDPLRSYIEEIDKASSRATDLTSKLLAFGRKQILEIKVIDLNNILKGLEEMLRRIIREDIELQIITDQPLSKIKADPTQIEQIIINLAANARDAMPDGGRLIIETANVKLDDEYASKHIDVKSGQYVMLSVSDTGAGMTEEVREKIFEPFFTTKEFGRGTGLGLATVYGIVKQSGGNIWVYSEVGRGTTFKIYFPQAVEPLDELKKKEVDVEILHGNETILVVEDENAVRELAVMALEMQGYKVLSASGGREALLICQKYIDPIRLILTDVVMPGMSGRTLAERLKEIHPEMKALYMSGYTDNAIVHHGILEAGVNFIQKPFTFEKLAKKVREVLDSK